MSMEPSVDPIDGAADHPRSDSTYPIDTGEFRVRRSHARLWLVLGSIVILGTTALGVFRHSTAGDEQPPPSSAGQVANPNIESEAKLRAALAEKERKQCLAQRETLLKSEPSPGTPALDATRTELLLRTKLEPVIFIEPPEFDEDVPTSSKALRKTFATTRYPSSLLDQLTKAFRIDPEGGRRMLLREGYLYAEDTEQAFALVQHVRAEHLYNDERIWIQRGDQVLHAERRPRGSYRYTDGSLRGKEVSLVLFDRIGTGAPPPPLHRDLRSLQYRLHFDRLELLHVTPTHIVADLKYGGLIIPTVLKTEGARVELDCEVVSPAARKDLRLYRLRGQKKLAVVQGLRQAMLAQIDEGLPFDEPYREWGQQDGVLRYKWRDAFFAGKSRFDLNGDVYYVYDAQGRPKIPQVCIDFLTDTLERASGTWWSKLGEEPKRIVGELDFDTLNNAVLRRASAFIEHAHERSDWFDVYDTPPDKLIPFWQRQRFTAHLQNNVDRYKPGDIVVIRGHTNFEKKWERPIMHYHSFFIYERDPLSGIPIAIVGNAGVPSLRVWNTEMRRTPRRSIWHRIRPQLHWLERVVRPADAPLDTPAPLALGRD